MGKCYVYPGLFMDDRCEECELYDKCTTKDSISLIFASCPSCGLEVRLKKTFLEHNSVLCPICKERVLSTGRQDARTKAGAGKEKG